MQGIDLGEQYIDENKVTFPNAIAVFDGNAGVKIEYLNANNIGVTTEYEINNNKISTKDKVIYIEEHNESAINEILKTIKIKIYKKIEIKITLIKNHTNYMPLGTVATADKSYLDNTPDKAIDANIETYWGAPDYKGNLNLKFKETNSINKVQLKVGVSVTAKNTYIIKANGMVIGQKTLIVEKHPTNLTNVDIDVVSGNYNEIEIECKSEGVEGHNFAGSWISICEVLLSDKEEVVASDTCIVTNLGNHIQVIDEHTLLYLKGDSFNDLSLNPKTVTAIDVSIVDDDLFGKSFKANSGVIYIPTKEITLDGRTSFTIEWFENLTSGYDAGIFSTNEKIHHGLLLGYYELDNSTIYCSSDGNSWNVIRREVCGGKTFNKWIHKAFCYSKENLTLYCFENGIKTYEKKLQQELSIYCGDKLSFFDAWTNKVDANVSNIRISSVARWTEDFEVPTEPYDYPCKIEILEQTEHHIDFKVLINIATVNKVEIYVNNEIEKEYNDTFENLIFDIIYDEKYIIGKNEIKFVIDYNENKKIEKKVYHYRQRIDENTMFFLNGTDIVDSSYDPKTISNNGVTMSDGGKFGKFYNMKTGYLQIQNFNPHFRNFSVELYLKLNENNTLDVLLDTRDFSHGKGYVIYTESHVLKFQIDKSSSSSSSIDYSSFDKNVYHHFVFEIKDYKYVKLYHNGKLKKNDTLSELPQEHVSNNIYMSKRCDGGNYSFTHELSMFRISNMNIYNENFTPTNIPYCHEPILKVNQISENQLTISIDDMSNVMNRLEIFINGALKKTIIEDFNDISFNSLMYNYNDGFNELGFLMTFNNNVKRIRKIIKAYKHKNGIIVASKSFEVKKVLFDRVYTHFKPFFLGHGNVNVLYSVDDNEFTYCNANSFTQINSNNIKLMFLMDLDAKIEAYKIYVKDFIDTSDINFNEILPPPNNIDKFPVTSGGGVSKELLEDIEGNDNILNNKILELQKHVEKINNELISVEDKVYDIEFNVDEYHKNTNLKHNQLTDTLINDRYIKQLVDCELDINNDNVK
ncbi:LamG-like jellyroll fold domain-containing protein [Clostridioides difficile]